MTWHQNGTKMAPMSPGLKELCDAYSLARREYYFDRLLLSYSSMVSSIIVHVFILICIVFYISVFLWSPHSCIAFIWLDCLGRQLHLLYLLHLLDWIVEVSNCIYLIGLLRSPRNFDSILGLYRTGKLHLSQGVRTPSIHIQPLTATVHLSFQLIIFTLRVKDLTNISYFHSIPHLYNSLQGWW